MFKEQLRAILRASAFGHVRIMFPMIIAMEELKNAKALVKECMKELDERGQAYDKNIEMGMMIETPASVMLADEFAKEADFFSIGANDLTQYILVVDRGNKKIAKMYDYFNPAVVRAIKQVIEAGHKKASKSVCVVRWLVIRKQSNSFWILVWMSLVCPLEVSIT